ncbi:MAG TPA: FKBP-type peptidyl-prolyl cis-trans isomerase [Solirubrobacteraceae bacterium]|nr:FKBP-type peptidyl-prolyl cis-trans isomerase [Solirubrobacteraceae bacterium]
MSPRRVLVLPLALAALAAGCGDDDEGEPAATATAPAATSTAPAAPTTATTAKPGPGGEDDDVSKKPTVEKGSGAAPTELVVEDVVEGSGPGAKSGDQLTMHYVGVDYATGKQFDASWDRGEPFSLQLGAGMVIPGWDRGLVGIKKGGRRKLVIPPDLAYGAQGAPPAIAPNATLIFVVDRIS